MTKHLLYPLLASAALSLAACSSETPAEPVAADTAMADETANTDATGAGTIVDVASGNPDFSTLVAAVQAAGLVETLSGAGPFTVFAPTNAAFEKLPAGAVDGLLKPEMKSDLTKVLTYHVVPGNIDAAALVQQIQAGGGSAMLKTVEGAELTAKLDGETVTLTDAKGDVARVTTADVRQSNGVIHVIDTVLMP